MFSQFGIVTIDLQILTMLSPLLLSPMVIFTNAAWRHRITYAIITFVLSCMTWLGTDEMDHTDRLLLSIIQCMEWITMLFLSMNIYYKEKD